MFSPLKKLALGAIVAATLALASAMPGMTSTASACEECRTGPRATANNVYSAVAAYQQWWINLLAQPVMVFPQENADKQLNSFLDTLYAILGIKLP